MKKLFVLLLALVSVGAFAQVKVDVATSGTAFVVKGAGSADPTAYIAMDGADSDTITFKAADADGKYGATIYYDLYNKTVVGAKYMEFSNWSAWYQYDFGKFEIGSAGGGFQSDLNNDIIDTWDTDGFGTGIIYTSPAFSGLSLQAYYRIPDDATTPTVADSVMESGFAVQYAIENTLTIKALAMLGTDIAVDDDMKANVYFDFTGVENLDVYGDFQYDQTKADSLFDIGAAYTMGALKVIGEFESNWGGDDFLYDAVGQATYTLNDKIYVRARGAYLDNDAAKDADYYVKGYVNYAFGNGLSTTAMVGYQKSADVLYQLYLGYSISL